MDAREYINGKQLDEDLKKVSFEKEPEIDRLEQAMQNKGFGVELTTYLGSVGLTGKNENGYYTVGSEINTDGDFAITFFKDYGRLKEWFDEWQGEGFYNYLVELFNEQQ